MQKKVPFLQKKLTAVRLLSNEDGKLSIRSDLRFNATAVHVMSLTDSAGGCGSAHALSPSR